MKAADRQALDRIQSMDYALRQIRKIGIEEFEKELRVRCRTGIDIRLTPKELDDCSQKIKEMCLDTVLTMAIAVLHDEFDFGKKRIQRFFDRYELKASCLKGGFVTWQDYLDTIKEELDITIDIRLNE